MDPNTILSTLFDILQVYSTACVIPHEATTLYRPTPFIKQQFVKDINNNEMTLNKVATRPIRSGCGTRKYCTSPYDKQEKLKRKLCHSMKKRLIKISGNNNCTCNSLISCDTDTHCDQCCCNSAKPLTCYFNNSEKHYEPQSTMNKYGTTNSKTSFKNHVISSTSQPCKPARAYSIMNISR